MGAATLQQLQTPPAAREQQTPVVTAGFFNLQGFELIQRVSKAFSQSDLVPTQYQNNLPNCMIAMDMAQRMGANPLMVMQNLYIVHNTPGWSSKFLIATINVCGRFSALRYEWKGEPGTDEYGCRAWTIEKSTGERLDGIWVTWAMVKAEGWNGRKGSKWLTMPDQMFVYRSAAFWQRAYAPELGMGLQTAEELGDVFEVTPDATGAYSVSVEELQKPSVKSELQVQPAVQEAIERAPETIDHGTGEITAGQPLPNAGMGDAPFGLQDALAAVKRGALDEATDMARSFDQREHDIVANAIANQQQPEQSARRSRRPQMDLD